MNTTYEYSPALMSKYYLVHAGINNYAWFDTYDQAHAYLLSKWVDRRIATEVFTPAK
jgi:hypothetical protein